jgi:signal recognition particle receptor subunit beta
MRAAFHETAPLLPSPFIHLITEGRNTHDIRHLHHVLHALTSLPPSQHVPSLLVLAHKSDLLKSSSSTAITRVRTILARELTRRRHAQVSGAGTTAGLEALGEEGEGKGELGGLECAGEKLEFDWDNWEGGEVTFAGTWVKVAAEAEARENGLQELREWMQLL